VTRDAVVAPASIADMTFSLCDTAGLAEGSQQMFEGPNHWASMGAEARNK
jgi:predicted GTPase